MNETRQIYPPYESLTLEETLSTTNSQSATTATHSYGRQHQLLILPFNASFSSFSPSLCATKRFNMTLSPLRTNQSSDMDNRFHPPQLTVAPTFHSLGYINNPTLRATFLWVRAPRDLTLQFIRSHAWRYEPHGPSRQISRLPLSQVYDQFREFELNSS